MITILILWQRNRVITIGWVMKIIFIEIVPYFVNLREKKSTRNGTIMKF